MEQKIVGERFMLAYLYEQTIVKGEIVYLAKMFNDLPYGGTQINSLLDRLYDHCLINSKWVKGPKTWVKSIVLNQDIVPLAKEEYLKLVEQRKEEEKEKEKEKEK